MSFKGFLKKAGAVILKGAETLPTVGPMIKAYTPDKIDRIIDIVTDKTEEMSEGKFKPKVIIRTLVGSKTPFYPGLQHCSDYTEAMKYLLKNIDIVSLKIAEDVIPAYKKALESDRSTLIIEEADLYNEEIITGKSTTKD